MRLGRITIFVDKSWIISIDLPILRNLRKGTIIYTEAIDTPTSSIVLQGTRAIVNGFNFESSDGRSAPSGMLGTDKKAAEQMAQKTKFAED